MKQKLFTVMFFAALTIIAVIFSYNEAEANWVLNSRFQLLEALVSMALTGVIFYSYCTLSDLRHTISYIYIGAIWMVLVTMIVYSVIRSEVILFVTNGMQYLAVAPIVAVICLCRQRKLDKATRQ